MSLCRDICSVDRPRNGSDHPVQIVRQYSNFSTSPYRLGIQLALYAWQVIHHTCEGKDCISSELGLPSKFSEFGDVL